jgi:hypothetical protein
MDAFGKLQAVEARREALEAQLLKPNIDIREQVAIRQQLSALSSEISTYASKIVAPRPPDTRPLMVRISDCWWADPLRSTATGIGIGSLVFSFWLSAVSCYMPWRHRVAPYTQKQINRRLLLGFQLESSEIPRIAKMAFATGVFLYLLRPADWRNADAKSSQQ